MNDPNQQHAQNTELTRRLNDLNDHLDAVFATDLDHPQRTEAFLTELARRTANTPDPSPTNSPATQPTPRAASRSPFPVGACVNTTPHRESPRLLVKALTVWIVGVTLGGFVILLVLLGGSPALILPTLMILPTLAAALHGAQSAMHRRQRDDSTHKPQVVITNVGLCMIGDHNQVFSRSQAVTIKGLTTITAEPAAKNEPASKQPTNETTATATERTSESVPAAEPAELAVTTPERATKPTPAKTETQAELRIRMGFMLDIADYGDRTTRAKARVQQRLAALIHQVLDDLDVRPSDADRQGTGDGILLFLPSQHDVQHALPALLHSTAAHLAADNKEFQDQLRLRMAVDIGPVRSTQLGFGGATATNLGRMLNSKPLRQWLTDHPNHDLAVIISDRLHSFVIAEDAPALPPTQFKQVPAQFKEFTTIAWVWTKNKPPH